MADVDTGRWNGPQRLSVPNATIRDTAGHSITDTRGLFVIHAALLRTGKVLMFCGHVEDSHYATLSYEFNPARPSDLMTPRPFPIGADLFCCHMVQLPDGRILAMGGSENFHAAGDTSFGAKHIAIYDPRSSTWSHAQTASSNNQLAFGRWYPTPILLSDGKVLVFSGRREQSAHTSPPLPFLIADRVEVLTPPNFASTTLTTGILGLSTYPGLHLMPNGKIYFTHTNWRQELTDPGERLFDPGTGTWGGTFTNTISQLAPATPARREEGMSVILPPIQDGKILVVGGSHAQTSANGTVDRPRDFHHVANADDSYTAAILDTNTNTWSVAPANPRALPNNQMLYGRTNGHCVLLPDSTVLIVGGHDGYKWSSESNGTFPSMTAEIFTPGTGFSDAAQMGRQRPDPDFRWEGSRMYHSVALLLPDGKVLVAGGADPNFEEPNLTYPTGWNGPKYGPTTPTGNIALNQKTYELYRPPYFFKGTRPTIKGKILIGGVPSEQVNYGQAFVIKTDQAASIDKVAFMRPGCPTHHTDTEQRYVRLDFTKSTGQLNVTAVSDGNVAPPGFYLLWIIDSQGRPCQNAKFIQLTGIPTNAAPPPAPSTPPATTTPATTEPTTPVPSSDSETCLIATAAYGSADSANVLYLRRLRTSLSSASPFGHRFIHHVNRTYYSFSPTVAHAMHTNPSLRRSVRATIVEPGVNAITLAERLARGNAHRLITLLMLEGVACLAALPLLLVVLGLRYSYEVLRAE